MGPSGRTRRKSSRRKSSQFKKNSVAVRPQNPETTALVHSIPTTSPPSNSSSSNDDDFPKTEGIEYEAVDDVVSTSGCSTPKGQRFRIPEVMTCPPAPKKQRVISNCSLQRSPIAFFAPPDLELFFYLALRGISV